MTPPATELEQLRRQNALLLKRLLAVSRERDELTKKLAALRAPEAPNNELPMHAARAK